MPVEIIYKKSPQLRFDFAYSVYLDAIKNIFQGAHPMVINSMSGAVWDGKITLFSGGWDKVVKQWTLDKNTLKPEASCNVDIVINTLTVGEKGEIYAAGGDGHIVRFEI